MEAVDGVPSAERPGRKPAEILGRWRPRRIELRLGHQCLQRRLRGGGQHGREISLPKGFDGRPPAQLWIGRREPRNHVPAFDVVRGNHHEGLGKAANDVTAVELEGRVHEATLSRYEGRGVDASGPDH